MSSSNNFVVQPLTLAPPQHYAYVPEPVISFGNSFVDDRFLNIEEYRPVPQYVPPQQLRGGLSSNVQNIPEELSYIPLVVPQLQPQYPPGFLPPTSETTFPIGAVESRRDPMYVE